MKTKIIGVMLLIFLALFLLGCTEGDGSSSIENQETISEEKNTDDLSETKKSENTEKDEKEIKFEDPEYVFYYNGEYIGKTSKELYKTLQIEGDNWALPLYGDNNKLYLEYNGEKIIEVINKERDNPTEWGYFKIKDDAFAYTKRIEGKTHLFFNSEDLGNIENIADMEYSVKMSYGLIIKDGHIAYTLVEKQLDEFYPNDSGKNAIALYFDGEKILEEKLIKDSEEVGFVTLDYDYLDKKIIDFDISGNNIGVTTIINENNDSDTTGEWKDASIRYSLNGNEAINTNLNNIKKNSSNEYNHYLWPQISINKKEALIYTYPEEEAVKGNIYDNIDLKGYPYEFNVNDARWIYLIRSKDGEKCTLFVDGENKGIIKSDNGCYGIEIAITKDNYASNYDLDEDGLIYNGTKYPGGKVLGFEGNNIYYELKIDPDDIYSAREYYKNNEKICQEKIIGDSTFKDGHIITISPHNKNYDYYSNEYTYEGQKFTYNTHALIFDCEKQEIKNPFGENFSLDPILAKTANGNTATIVKKEKIVIE